MFYFANNKLQILIEKLVLKACFPSRLCDNLDSSDPDISGSITNFWLDGECGRSFQYPPYYENDHLCSRGKIMPYHFHSYIFDRCVFLQN